MLLLLLLVVDVSRYVVEACEGKPQVAQEDGRRGRHDEGRKGCCAVSAVFCLSICYYSLSLLYSITVLYSLKPSIVGTSSKQLLSPNDDSIQPPRLLDIHTRIKETLAAE